MLITALAKTPKNTTELPSTDHWKIWPFYCARSFERKNVIYSDPSIKLIKTLAIFLLTKDKPLKSKDLRSTFIFIYMKDADLSYPKHDCD